MPASSALYNSHWHLVSGQKPRLRRDVSIHRQYYRDELWYVLTDSLRNKYYRFRPAAWQFITQLNGSVTIQAIWEACLKEAPENAPSQDEVIHILTQLNQARLLQWELPPNWSAVEATQPSNPQRSLQQGFSSLFYFRIPPLGPGTLPARPLALVSGALQPLGRCIDLVARPAGRQKCHRPV